MTSISSPRTIRIGGASGYWGDTSDAPRQLIETGHIDYLVFDYLAEVTMSILAKLKSRSEDAGYAHDFIFAVMKPLIGQIAEQKIKVIANAGGVNLEACRRALAKVAEEAGASLRIATVEGDNLLGRADELRALDIREMQAGTPLPEKLMSVNAYLGAFPIAAALGAGADIVLTGRCVDSAVSLAPLIHEFGWTANDFDKLAAGSLCGHLLECGAQATGGNFTDWRDVEQGWDNVGFPIAEVSADGSFIVTKPPGTGGAVTPLTVGEQLLYEIGDPSAYLLPDVSCDFTEVTLSQAGLDRVLVKGARGRAPTPTYKVSATYAGGYKSVGSTVIVGYDAPEKARRTGEAILKRTTRMLAEKGLPPFRATSLDVVGNDTLYGNMNGHAIAGLRECVLRLAIQHDKTEGAELFSKEYVGTGLSMSTGRCGLEGGRPSVSPIVKLFSFLLDKSIVPILVRLDGDEVPFALAKLAASAPYNPVKASAEETNASEGRLVEVPLISLAVARSGDKGNDANIGVIVRDPKYLPAIRNALTEKSVKQYFAHYAEGPVERYDLPGMHALNFVLRSSLGGGGTSSVRLDVQAKTYAQLLLSIPVSIPEGWSNEVKIP